MFSTTNTKTNAKEHTPSSKEHKEATKKNSLYLLLEKYQRKNKAEGVTKQDQQLQQMPSWFIHRIQKELPEFEDILDSNHKSVTTSNLDSTNSSIILPLPINCSGTCDGDDDDDGNDDDDDDGGGSDGSGGGGGVSYVNCYDNGNTAATVDSKNMLDKRKDSSHALLETCSTPTTSLKPLPSALSSPLKRKNSSDGKEKKKIVRFDLPKVCTQNEQKGDFIATGSYSDEVLKTVRSMACNLFIRMKHFATRILTEEEEEQESKIKKHHRSGLYNTNESEKNQQQKHQTGIHPSKTISSRKQNDDNLTDTVGIKSASAPATTDAQVPTQNRLRILKDWLYKCTKMLNIIELLLYTFHRMRMWQWARVVLQLRALFYSTFQVLWGFTYLFDNASAYFKSQSDDTQGITSSQYDPNPYRHYQSSQYPSSRQYGDSQYGGPLERDYFDTPYLGEEQEDLFP